MESERSLPVSQAPAFVHFYINQFFINNPTGGIRSWVRIGFRLKKMTNMSWEVKVAGA